MSTQSYSSFVVVLVLERLGRCVVFKPSSAWRRAALARAWRPTEICNTFVLRSQIFEDEYDYELDDLDLPFLVDRIRDGLDHLHVLQAFTETGLG